MNRILTDLPKKKIGNKECIVWSKISDTKIEVEYNDNVYDLFIRGRNSNNKSLIDVSLYNAYGIYKEEDFKPTLTTHFINGGFGNIINNKLAYRYNVGDIVKSGNDTEYEILEQTRNTYNLKSYTVKCVKCNSIKYFYGELEIGNHDCNQCINGFRLNIGDLFQNDKIDIIIYDRYYKKRGKRLWRFYKYKCNKCGYEGEKEELKLINYNRGCPCCCPNPQVVDENINSIYANAKWMIDLGVSIGDSKKYTPSSNKKIEVICPLCGCKKFIKLCDIYKNKSIRCFCSDNVPYPEKFVISFLNQLDIQFEKEYSPEWIKPKRYDFYIPSLNLIIETHGNQHYSEGFSYRGGRTLEEEQFNDEYKNNIALHNKIKDYIIIDCRESNMDYIKQNIVNSKLKDLLDLNIVDWIECDRFALSNVVYEVCKYWSDKEDWETTSTIANNNKWGIKGKGTIRTYLKQGIKHGWCYYDALDEFEKSKFKKSINA